MKKQESPREYLGRLVKNLQPLHGTEYKVVFNLHENTFFQKIVPKEILEKGVRIRPIDYFKALVFLNYYTRIIEDNYQVCDNLVTLSKVLRKEERESGKDGEASYLSLEAVVLESAILTKERCFKKRKNICFDKKEKQEIVKRYLAESSLNLDSPGIRKLDPYYEAIGEMLCALVEDKIKPYLSEISRRTELEALVFTNSILPLLNAKESKEIYDNLSRKDYLSASLIALDKIVKKVSISQLKSAIANKND